MPRATIFFVEYKARLAVAGLGKSGLPLLRPVIYQLHELRTQGALAKNVGQPHNRLANRANALDNLRPLLQQRFEFGLYLHDHLLHMSCAPHSRGLVLPQSLPGQSVRRGSRNRPHTAALSIFAARGGWTVGSATGTDAVPPGANAWFAVIVASPHYTGCQGETKLPTLGQGKNRAFTCLPASGDWQN